MHKCFSDKDTGGITECEQCEKVSLVAFFGESEPENFDAMKMGVNNLANTTNTNGNRGNYRQPSMVTFGVSRALHALMNAKNGSRREKCVLIVPDSDEMPRNNYDNCHFVEYTDESFVFRFTVAISKLTRELTERKFNSNGRQSLREIVVCGLGS